MEASSWRMALSFIVVLPGFMPPSSLTGATLNMFAAITVLFAIAARPGSGSLPGRGSQSTPAAPIRRRVMNPMLTHHEIYTIPLGGGTSATDLSRSSPASRSEEHTSELQSLMRISYAVFCLQKKNTHTTQKEQHNNK